MFESDERSNYAAIVNLSALAFSVLLTFCFAQLRHRKIMFKTIKYSQVLKQFENGVYNKHLTFETIALGQQGDDYLDQSEKIKLLTA